MAYVLKGRPGGCIACEALKAGVTAESLVLFRGKTCFVMLNRYPYQGAHLMVAPHRHTASLPDLPADEHLDLSETLRRALRALGEVLRPDGFNVGMNLGTCAGAGVADHLHWHIVPRWPGDTNFMPILAETRVMPQHLLETYERLLPAFDWLARG